MSAKKALCVIPCYNESENLQSLFKDLVATNLGSTCDFLFIDDCSKDQTSEIIAAAGYKLIRHAHNLGYGGGVKTGLKYAFDNGYEKFVLFPGDHQRSAKDVIRLIQHHEKTGSDVVVGSKFHIYSQKYGPIGRRIGNRIYSGIAKFFWSSPIDDVLSGFKVYSVKSVIDLLPFLPNHYPLDIVFSYYASKTGLKITEIPVDCRYDKNTTKMRSIVFVSMKMLARLLQHVFFKPLPKSNPKSRSS